MTGQYFNTVTGKGWQGPMSISFTSTQTGSPQERAAFGVSISWQGTPAEYTHDLGPYTLLYDPGEGTGTVVDDGKYEPASVTIVKSASELEPPAGKVFVEWNTHPEGKGAGYRPGDTITLLENTTLTAVWGGE